MLKVKESHKNVILIIWFILLVIVAAAFVVFGLELIRSHSGSSIVANPIYNDSNEQILSDITDFSQIEDCLSVPWEDQNKCYDDFVKNYAGSLTTRDLLYQLELARGQSAQIEDNCHPMTHAIGRWTYVQKGNVGDAFESCDFTCHSGCYHGVMERVFFSEDELAKDLQHLSLDELRDKIPGICDAENFSNPTRSIIFQCLHGVGHAILYSLNYRLEEALAACDLLGSTYEQSSCYGGVVMENITAFEKDKRDIDPNDPHYPCSKLDEKYKNDCYQMQTSIMFELGMSSEAIADECNNAGAQRPKCFVSLGRDLSNRVRTGDPEYVAQVCEEYAGKHGFAYECIAGTTYALVDNTWSGQYAAEFCNRLGLMNQSTCYELSTSYLGSTYQKSEDEIAADCEQFAGANTELCKSSIKY